MARIFGPDQIPVLVKHVTLAIQSKPIQPFARKHPLVAKALGRGSEGFAMAFVLAINSLKKNGFLTLDSSPFPGDVISLTGKGTLADRIHRSEKSGKEGQFDRQYQQAFGEENATPEKKEVKTDQVAPEQSPKQLQKKSKARAGREEPTPSVKKTEIQKDPYKKTRLKKSASGRIRKAPSARMARARVRKR